MLTVETFGHFMEQLRPAGLVWGPTLLFLVIVGSMLDVVHLEGDHTSYLVLAPYPTLGLVHGGGEEGAFRRAHPGLAEPWWSRGDYLTLFELTDG
ncbi:MAG: hypothetical protein IPI67_39250 [Myxococcales bacterium]|nr:hypothetical protein [Myxococcales bacterium]